LPLCGFARDPAKDTSDENATLFLNSLRSRGFYDEALDYLDVLQNDPRSPKKLPAGFLEKLDYQRAQTLIEKAHSLPVADRAAILQQAHDLLVKYLARPNRSPNQAIDARFQLANLLVEQARDMVAGAHDLSRDASVRQLAASRTLFHEAETTFAAAQKEVEAALQRVGVVLPNDTSKAALRERLHGQQLHVRLSQAWLQYELALSYAAGSSERNAALSGAVAKFDLLISLIEPRGDILAGLYAKLGRGLSLREQGNSGQAFAVFEELLAQSDQPADFHALRGRAACEALETALAPGVRKVKPALDIAHAWLAANTESARPDATDLAIRFLGGEAALADVDANVQAIDQKAQRGEELRWAREQFAVVSRIPGPYQGRAKSHLLDPALGGESAREPRTFTEARDYAQAALARLAAAEAGFMTGVGNADPALEAQRQQRLATARNEAIRFCHAALRMRSNETPLDDLAALRYYLAFAEFKAGHFEEAAALGEEVAESGSAATAREAARVALASYDALYRAAKTDNARSPSLEQMQKLADSIVRRWGNQAEVDDARLVLLEAAARQGDLRQGEKILDQIPVDSLRRGEAELTYAMALWSQYRLTAKRQEKENAEQSLALRTQELLRSGLERVRPRVDAGLAVSQTMAAAVLALAELDLELGQTDDALIWLEDAKLGLMPLVASHAEATQQDRFVSQAWTVDLCVAVELERRDRAASAWENIEASIRQEGGGTNGAPAASSVPRQFTQSAIALGQSVQHEMQHAEANPERADRLSKAWQNFFTPSVAKSAIVGNKEQTFFHQAAIAEVYHGLAAALDSDGLRMPPEAEKLYREAMTAYKTLIARSEAHADYAPAPEALAAFRIRAAGCSRRLSDHRQALSLLLPVIDQYPNLVDAQVEAARIYQAWGDDNAEYFALAMDGSQRYREIWGWRELAQRVESRRGFQDIFFDARYNLAWCRFRQAQTAGDRAAKRRLLASAGSDILSVQRLHPDMGGAVWYDRYTELMRRIQRLADDPPIGLPPSPQK
jgi:hypothetical protein